MRVRAAVAALGTSERTAIKSELDALSAEIDDIVSDSKFNGTSLFSTAAQTTFTFQVNAESGDTFAATVATMGTTTLALTAGLIDVTSAASAATTLTSVDAAIQSVANAVSTVGDSQKRLTYKEQNLSVSMNNYEAARSRIADADFAQEQVKIVKLQILQQTGTASLAQANAAPQAVLSLF